MTPIPKNFHGMTSVIDSKMLHLAHLATHREAQGANLPVIPSVWVANEQSILFLSLGFTWLIRVGWLTGADRVSQQSSKQVKAIVIQTSFGEKGNRNAQHKQQATHVPMYVKILTFSCTDCFRSHINIFRDDILF